jgi:hypothetical protein
MAWYVIICAGPQDRTWNDDMEVTPVAKRAFDRLNYCMRNLDKILIDNGMADKVKAKSIKGLLIVGQDQEFLKNSLKQDRKREINQTSSIKIRTYGAFLRSYKRSNQGWLLDTIDRAIALFIKSKS